jgi:CHAT domain-containing protein
MTTPSRPLVDRRLWVLLLLAGGAGLLVGRVPTPAIAGNLFALPLTPASPVERTISPGHTDSFRVRLAPGEFLHAVVEQLGADVVVSFASPTGNLLLSVDSPNWRRGEEELFAVATAAGDYRLDVEDGDGAGRYRLRIDPLHPATSGDRLRANAASALSDAQRGDARSTPAAAEAAYRRAIELWERAGDPGQRAIAAYGLGKTYEDRDSDKALAIYREILPVWRGRIEGDILLNAIARCEISMEQWMDAEDALRQLKFQAEALGDELSLAAGLNNQALVMKYQGDFQRALDLFDRARSEFDRLGVPREEATVYDNIAEIDTDLGSLHEAVEAGKRALSLQVAAGDLRGQSRSLRNLGMAYRLMHADVLAVSDLTQSIALAHDDIQITARNALGMIYLEGGNPKRAVVEFEKALRLSQAAHERRGEGNAWGDLGAAYGQLNNPDQSLEAFARARKIYRDMNDMDAEASILFGRAQELRRLGKLDEALATIEESIDLVERLRTNPTGSDVRASFFDARHDYYELLTGVLMDLAERRPDQGYAELAFAASERTRTRTLLDSLAAARLDIRADAPADLRAQEAKIQRQLGAAQEREVRLAAAAPGSVSSKRFVELDDEIHRLESALERVRGEMRHANSRYRELVDPSPLTLREVQSQVLDEHTLLLEYSLGRDESFLWLIGRHSFEVHSLPGRAVIESAAVAAYDALASGRDDTPGEAAKETSDLAQILLAPIAGRLGDRPLFVIGDGTLERIPFAALPEPGPRTDRAATRLLVDRHEIVQPPSASLIRMLRREATGRRPAPKMVAILADPVFQADDPRVRHGAPTLRRDAASPSDAEDGTGLGGLKRLPSTASEADAIFQLVPAGAGLEAKGFAASRALAMNPDLGLYRIVHLATHSIFDARHPALSELVFSQIDEKGQPQDGRLHAYEIYGLKLPVDLVVLSACRTALGHQVRGEGLGGLTRGFMYAGASRVMVSLWNINDQSTSELMKHFYRGMLQRGRSPAAALREAQIEVRKQWPAPYYWAPFALQGDW